MRAQLRAAFVMFGLLTLVTGVIYPLIVTGFAQSLFSHEANGSLLEKDGKIVGSSLIGQPFDDPRYFWGRPSATSPSPYNGGASGGSNLGPTNSDLIDAVKLRVEKLREQHPERFGPVPADLVTASGSGLDPHISGDAAEYQAVRIARNRGLTIDRVRDLIQEHTTERTLGLLGEARVNVFELNLALDSIR